MYNGFEYPKRGWCPICQKYPKPGQANVYTGDLCPMCGETKLLSPRQKAIYLNAIKREGLATNE